MKQFFISILITVIAISSFAQDTTINQPPYKRFPTFPPVKLLNTDSITWFTKDELPKKTAVMLMYFNPECEHCRHETEQLVKNIDRFEKITIVMATSQPFDSMMAFRERYGLAQYRNIIVGQDKSFFLPTFYKMSSLPFLAFYNRKKDLISVFEGSMPMEKVLEELAK